MEPTLTPQKLAHVVFRTERLDEMVDWWTTLLGARVVFSNPFIAFLTYDDEHHRIAIARIPGLAPRPAEPAPGLEHVAFTYRTLGDLLVTYARLKAKGVLPYWCINHGPTTSLYYRDPDGNQAELQVDNFESVEALHAWFRSGAFAENPIGVVFDPDRLLERFRRGDPVEELVRQGSV